MRKSQQRRNHEDLDCDSDKLDDVELSTAIGTTREARLSKATGELSNDFDNLVDDGANMAFCRIDRGNMGYQRAVSVSGAKRRRGESARTEWK